MSLIRRLKKGITICREEEGMDGVREKKNDVLKTAATETET